MRAWRSDEAPSVVTSLLEHRPAGLVQTRLLAPQAGRDGADVWDFAGAEAIDVGRAGLALLRCADREPTRCRSAKGKDRASKPDGRGS
jgi:hypothetical protein